MNRLRGFTLLELLIGLTLLGFMLALLFSGFRLATQTWDAIETRIQDSANDQASLALLRRLIGTVQPLHWGRQLGRPLAFSGQPQRLAMICLLTEQLGPRTVELAIERSNAEDGKRGSLHLVLREQPVRYGADSFAEGLGDVEAHPLIDGLEDASIRYFGTITKQDAPQWHEVWNSSDLLPKLVHIHLVPLGERPIDIVVATMITGNRSAGDRIVVGGTQ